MDEKDSSDAEGFIAPAGVLAAVAATTAADACKKSRRVRISLGVFTMRSLDRISLCEFASYSSLTFEALHR
jgi:hypothetical protein